MKRATKRATERNLRAPRPPRRQRGVAVITALLLTTLAVAIVANLFWQQQVQVRSMENQRLQLQTKWILRGALDWATLVLQSGMNNMYTSLDQPWATPLAETRLDQYIERERVAGETFDATLSGGITDACSRYNLRNLADNGVPDADQVELFKRLLSNLQLDQGLANRAARFVAEGQPLQPTQGTDGQQSPQQPQPQRTARTGNPMPILQVDDLLAVTGFTPAVVDRLRPFVTVLPGKTPVNVNTADAEVLAAAANLSVSEANTLMVRRKQAAWITLGNFDSETSAQRRGPLAPGSVEVKCDYFLVNSRIRLDRAALDAEALMNRSTMPPTVEWIRQK
jgi:general secretion pathway protein K